ncbi:putative siderophore transport system permease protein YfhA [Streptomyces sp. YIM 130001]|uniref:FecCD family ABC transporter permease n=1 Tax=Streptomyces sp. YIM 130001 TaxID=2259644 RepID=UPI000E64A98A|nr:iron chelate uptake ABC transporter family permease subunit [Streptomyces sp. YIM 130001]RII14765.1 putative siderophore transport system permease protein YfhA [Streptomyces sp. YIM 130001]
MTAPVIDGGPAERRARTEAAIQEVSRARHAGRRRWVVVSAGLALCALAVFCVSLSVGDMVVPLADVVATLSGDGPGGAEFVIMELRLPRALLAVLIGMAFGTAGAVFQTLLRNPLASPDIIGISAGASAGAAIGSLGFQLSGLALSMTALAGAMIAGIAIYLLAWRNGVVGQRLVLVGLGVAAGLVSLVSYLMTRAEVTDAQQLLGWLKGSLNGRSWDQLWPLVIGLSVLGPLTVLAARLLPALQLGDDTAAGLGTRVEPSRLALLACATALAGVATAAAGPVDFVALLSAPIARRLVPGRPALLPAALTGAVMVLTADLVAQHLLPSTQLPVGVVTSIIGAPYLLFLLARANRVGRGG